jgi:hypothetical protein
MQLGIYLRELWDRKLGLLAVLLVALVVATRVSGGSLLPPRIGGGSMDVASASTHVVVDTPRSTIIDLRQTTNSFAEMTNRALLLGNVMASTPVRSYIAESAGVPPEALKITPPTTPEEPRQIADETNQPKSTDILKAPDEYRLSIHANPTVPVLDLYAEAPTQAAAINLADGAVEGLRDYLIEISTKHGTPASVEVRLVQLGRATGAQINPGASLQVTALAFLFTFALGCAVVIFYSRVRRGFQAPEYGGPGLSGRPG